MSSNLSGLPPSALARLNTVANIQAVAVKLINLPDGLQNNAAPVKITGTVAGQNPDGSLQVQTERGIVNILLKDKQPLPQGQKLEIDIPAGRAPQQAQIRQAPVEPAQPPPANTSATAPATAPPPPSLAAQLGSTLSSAAAAAALKLERVANIRPTEIEDAVKAAVAKITDMAGVKAPTAPLQPGQNVRLLPLLSGQGHPVQIQPGQVPALPQQALLTALATLTDQLPEAQQPLKTQLSSLISRMDLSSLHLPASDSKTAPALPPQIQTILETVTSSRDTKMALYEAVKTFATTKPVDMQVSALMTQPLRPNLPALPGQIQIALAQTPPVSGGALPATAPAAPPQIIPAQITGFTAQNLPVISLTNPVSGQTQIYVGQFQAGNLQPGSPILLTPLPDKTAAAPLLQASSSPTPLAGWLRPEIWGSLTDLVDTVQQVNPAMAHTMTQVLPSPSQPQNLGGLALLFLSVMKSGDLESWLPPQMAMMLRQTGKTDTLRAVGTDINVGTRLDATPLPQDWRAAILPLYHEQQIYKVPLYYKHHDEDGKDGERDKRNRLMRFLFDLKLARMGNVQIDGFMQPQRLDMIMRTKSPLSTPMQRTMQGLYATAMERSNLHGELTFQFKPEHWVSIDIPVTADEIGATA